MVTLRRPKYVRRDEPLRGRSRRVLAIFTSGTRRELRRVLNLLILGLAVIFGVILTILNIFLFPLFNPGQEVTAGLFFTTLTNPAVLILILLVAASVGSGLISDDIRHMSMTLYLSRPLTARDYLLAKASVVVFAVFLAAAFPGILAPVVAAILRYVSWEVALPALGAGLAFGLLATGLVAFLALMFSSLTARKGVAAAGTFATMLALQGLGESLSDAFDVQEILYIAPYQNLLSVAEVLYGVEAGPLSWPVSLAIVLGVILLTAAVAYLRIGAMEVVAP